MIGNLHYSINKIPRGLPRGYSLSYPERSCKAHQECKIGIDVVFALQEVSRKHSIPEQEQHGRRSKSFNLRSS